MLSQLMDRFERTIYNYLVVFLGDRDLAADCTQDTFLRAYQQLCEDRPVTAPWLYRVARNRALDEFRRKQRERSKQEKLEQQLEPNSTESNRSAAVRKVLDQMSPEDRELLYLFIVDGFRGPDIAQMLDISIGAVHMRISRARRRFRQLYSDPPST